MKIAVIYYSGTGNVHALAGALALGAEDTGAEVRLRRVRETAEREGVFVPDKHYAEASAGVSEATLDDLEWAEGIALGSPSRFGLPASQLLAFLQTLGPLWAEGSLAGKAATSFASAQHAHGGAESTILAINNVFYHWGCLIVPSGYGGHALNGAGGNPYGASWVSGDNALPVAHSALDVARLQGSSLARYADLLHK